MSKTFHLSPARRNKLLPNLIDDQSFFRAVPNHDRERATSTFSSISLEILSSRDLISEELRMRTVSLPRLRNHRKINSVVAQSLLKTATQYEEGMTASYASYTDDDSSDEKSPIVKISPFPNVRTDSYLNSRLHPDSLPPYLKPRTPGIRKARPKLHCRNGEAEKKRKQLEALATKERKAKAPGKCRHTRRRSVRSDAFAQKRESEVAKRHPVRKQFVYSELVQVELQKLTPKRIPGGKLKPIYNRRTQEGDIDIPTELHISFDNLSLKPGDEKNDFSDSPVAINKRRKEELQALLERRKKIQLQMVHKKKRKVHFLLLDVSRNGKVNKQVTIEGRTQNDNGIVSASQSSKHGIEEGAKEGDGTQMNINDDV